MNMNARRLDDKLNGAALAVIVAVVLSICSTLVSIEVDSGAYAAAPAAATPVQAVASIAVVGAH
jgi:hypothetical protein